MKCYQYANVFLFKFYLWRLLEFAFSHFYLLPLLQSILKNTYHQTPETVTSKIPSSSEMAVPAPSLLLYLLYKQHPSVSSMAGKHPKKGWMQGGKYFPAPEMSCNHCHFNPNPGCLISFRLILLQLIEQPDIYASHVLPHPLIKPNYIWCAFSWASPQNNKVGHFIIKYISISSTKTDALDQKLTPGVTVLQSIMNLACFTILFKAVAYVTHETISIQTKALFSESQNIPKWLYINLGVIFRLSIDILVSKWFCSGSCRKAEEGWALCGKDNARESLLWVGPSLCHRFGLSLLPRKNLHREYF